MAHNQRNRNERGSLSIEFVGGFIVFIFLLAIAFQAMLAMYSLSQANSAARNAARAEAISAGSGESAGFEAVSPGLQKAGTEVRCSGAGEEVTCDATIAVPVFNMPEHPNWFPDLRVTRSATQPVTEVR